MTAAVVTPRDFLRIVRENPGLFPRQALAQRARLSRSAVFNMLQARNPRLRGSPDPKLTTLEQLIEGCGGRLLVTLPPSIAADLSRRDKKAR